MKFVFLYTDLLIWLLFFLLVGWSCYAIFMRKNIGDFLNLLKKKSTLIAFLFLVFFFFIALLDSIHFTKMDAKNQKESPILSVLDEILQPIIHSAEKTYSAPFAIKSFAKENKTEADGSILRTQIRLTNAGNHLQNEKDHAGDVIKKFLQALLFSAIITLVTCLVIFLIYHLRKSRVGDHIEINLTMTGLQKLLQNNLFLLAVLFVFYFALGVSIFVAPYYHIFGTDKTGNDVFYIVLKGARTGIVIGALTTLIVTPIAIVFGMIAGYFGGIIDDIVQYIYTTLSSIPSILLIAAAMLLFQLGFEKESSEVAADKRLVYLCVIIGISSWTGLCRLIRAETLKLKEVEYVQAAKTVGLSHFLIMVKHIMPNLLHIVIITIILNFSGLVLAEAVLAYVGIGVDPSMHSWGNMINQARLELSRDPVVWWNLSAAFTFMLLLVLSANIFGDAVRDALDPKTRRDI